MQTSTDNKPLWEKHILLIGYALNGALLLAMYALVVFCRWQSILPLIPPGILGLLFGLNTLRMLDFVFFLLMRKRWLFALFTLIGTALILCAVGFGLFHLVAIHAHASFALENEFW